MAYGTSMASHASVQQHVSIEILLARKAFRASVAHIGTNLFVDIRLVHLQTGLAIELLVAHVAREAILARMEKEMRLQAARLYKGARTMWTLVRFLACE